MSDQNKDAEAALRKLGQFLREDFVSKHPTPQKSRDTVRKAVRDQWEQEQKAKNQTPAGPSSPKQPGKRSDPEPEP